TTVYTINTGTTFSLQCSNSAGVSNVATAQVAVTAPPPTVPTVTLSANPTSVTAGGSSTLTWSVNNSPTSCTASNDRGNAYWSGSVNINGGSITVYGINNVTNFSIQCSNSAGTSSPATAQVTTTQPGASATLSANPTSTTSGGSSLLSWVVSGTPGYCYISNDQGNSSFEGYVGGSSSSQTAYNIYSDTTFTIQCYDYTYGWSPISSAVVTIGASALPPTVALVASPTSVTTGGSSLLTWTVTGSAYYCYAYNNQSNTSWSGYPVGYSSNKTVTSINATTIFSIQCLNDYGWSNTATATVTAGSSFPDLTAGAPTPATATINTATTFSSSIQNIGTASTGGGFKNFFQVAGGSFGTTSAPTDLAYSNMSTLAASASAIATSAVTFTSAGTYQVRACADLISSRDTGGSIAESNESNNCSTWTTVTASSAAPNVDLVAAAPTPTTAVVNVSQSFSSTITNNGTVTTGSPFWYFYAFDNDSDHAIWTANSSGYYSSALAGGASTNAAFAYTFPTTGTWYVKNCADQNINQIGSIAESNEGNNCSAWTAVTVSSGLPTGSISATNCTILKNASTCNSSVTWSTNNPVGTSSVVKPTNVTVSSGNSGTNVPIAVKYNFETFYLYNNAVQLGLVNVFSSCASGTSWDGSKCAVNTSNSCANGATNYPTCTTTGGTCLNGATNPPVCTINGGGCLNGATNPPACTSNASGLCLNGATNPPVCTTDASGLCLNGASNPPTCFDKTPIFIEN
ncbi:hypothetical protein K2P96_00125, partial [Patescibacteria group bacterium]|nr:hypothetical protein [Patescibacteria group bacterium]